MLSFVLLLFIAIPLSGAQPRTEEKTKPQSAAQNGGTVPVVTPAPTTVPAAGYPIPPVKRVNSWYINDNSPVTTDSDSDNETGEQ